MRFVPVKTAEQQAGLMLMGVRDRLIRSRCNLTNAIRSFAAEFGLTVPTGDHHLPSLFDRIATDNDLPVLARELFAIQVAEYDHLRAQIAEVNEKLQAWHRSNECSRRLAQIPGVGPIGAAMLLMKTPAPEGFRSGRHFAAWLGLTPKDHSTGGKVRLGTITRAGDESLRRVLVLGATSLLRQVRAGNGRDRGALSAWLHQLLQRKPPKLVAVALANKIARTAWKMMMTGQAYSRGLCHAHIRDQSGGELRISNRADLMPELAG